MSLNFIPKVELRPISEIRPNPRSARQHNRKKIEKLKALIREAGGITTPLLVDLETMVWAGHARLQALIEMGVEQVPVIVLSHLDVLQLRRLMIADNRIVLEANWDQDILVTELTELSAPELDVDVSLTGFDAAEIEGLFSSFDGKPEKEKPNPQDQVEAIDRSKPSISALGELWRLGAHRLLVGNALQSSSYETLLAGETVHQIVSDTPYNVRIEGHVGGLGSVHHAEFAMAAGEMSSEQFQEFLHVAIRLMISHTKDGAIAMIFMDWRHEDELRSAAKGANLKLINLAVWDKINGGMGSLYRSQHELILIFKHGEAPHTNNVELGRHGRYRTNIWRYAGASMFRKGRQTDLETHPTVKPVALLMDAIKDCSRRGEIILDPFGGSGSTLLAAERTGRQARLIELDPYYCDATIRRWQSLTRRDAIEDVTGQSFSARELNRGADLLGDAA